MPPDGEVAPPKTKGRTGPWPVAILAIGCVAVLAVLGGSLALQVGYATGDRALSERCRTELTIKLPDEEKLAEGASGVCNIVEAFESQAQTGLLIAGIGLGALAMAGGFSTYKRMPSKRMREQCIAGAVLGVQAIAAAAFIQWFRSGDHLLTFTRNFLNFRLLEGAWSGFVRGAVNTLRLAFGGELGGIVIGLLLSVLVLSERRVVRAPARMYINLFRGTPLIWQLSFFYFLFNLGLGLPLQAFTVGLIVFALNTGAYAAEVFRAGIQSIEKGQMEAARSLGMTYLQAMRYAIVPQAVRRVIPPLMNEFVILIKDTSLMLVLGLAADELDIYGFGRAAFSDSRNATFFVATAVAYLVVTLPLIGIVNAVEKRVHSGLTGMGR